MTAHRKDACGAINMVVLVTVLVILIPINTYGSDRRWKSIDGLIC